MAKPREPRPPRKRAPRKDPSPAALQLASSVEAALTAPPPAEIAIQPSPPDLYAAHPPRPAYHPQTRVEWVEECRERAAILEYEANMTRAQAEAYALELVGPNPERTP